MAHNIQERDRMIYVGATPWHGLGKKLENYLTTVEALQEAGMDRIIEKVPLATADGHEVKGFFGTRYMDDPGEVLGVVTDQYQVCQNAEVVSIGDYLLGAGAATVETAGTLKNGRNVWMLFRLSESVEPIPGDVCDTYLLASGAHDGTQAVQWQTTSVRAVCDNTVTLARNTAGVLTYRFVHTESMTEQMEEGKKFLKWAMESRGRTLAMFRTLAKTELSEAVIAEYFKTVYPDRSKSAPEWMISEAYEAGRTKRAEQLKKDGIPDEGQIEARAKCMALHNGEGRGSENPGVQGTAWGAFHAVTELVDHWTGNPKRVSADEALARTRAENRFNRTMFGQGNDVKTRALTAALELCKN